VDQRDVIAFLSTPQAFGAGCDRVDRLETHISIVFLGGDHAFKLKRAVRLPYVDYSTPERRKACCDTEVRLNRRTAPGLYRGVVAVTQSSTGALEIGGVGTPVDWLVAMRRFDQDRLLDAVARRGELDETLAARIGAAAADLHASADARHDHGGLAAMQWVVDENDAELTAAGAVVSQPARARLFEASSAALRRHGDLLESRREQGWVRESHGDLHLGNIFLAGDRPVIFDCIEFNDELSCIDVLYDVAFLAMDLVHRGLPAQANAALNAWLERLPHYDALGLLPLFLACRAAIRGKILITTARLADDPARIAYLHGDANAYLARALGFVAPEAGAIVAIGGLSGSGKSTLARHIAPAIGRSPGAVVLRSDVVRKRRLGVESTERLPDAAYGADVTTAVYEELVRSARDVARAGYVAIIDAVAGMEAQRAAIRQAAAAEHVPFVGLWLEAPLEMMEARLAARRGDASDATAPVLRRQQAQATAPSDWAHLDASQTADRVAEATLARTSRFGLRDAAGRCCGLPGIFPERCGIFGVAGAARAPQACGAGAAFEIAR
jgi:aminoglycoside phosphotransferase family enzyme/predicted kinase